MGKRPSLFLIDGMAIAYRSYFAFIQRPLVNSKGQNTSAVYGFVTFLNRILDNEHPDYIAVAFDTPEPTFRHKTYAPYKATREKMPEEMASQLDILKEVIRAYRIPIIELHGYEADDVIGTLAKQAEREKLDTFLVTSDKDFMQLVSKTIRMYKPGRQGTEVEKIGIEEVKKKFGVPPEKVIDVLGLIGDTSDNVPGVQGVGEKTAIPLIQKYGNLEKLLDDTANIPQKGLREKLERDRDKAILSKHLVTIDTNVPVDIDVHGLKAAQRDSDRLAELFRELEFSSLLRRLRGEPSPRTAAASESDEVSFEKPEDLQDLSQVEHRYVLVDSEKELARLGRQLSEVSEFAFDTETTDVDPLKAELVGLSFCLKAGEAFFVTVAPPDRVTATKPEGTTLFDAGQADRTPKGEPPDAVAGLPWDTIAGVLRPALENEAIGKVGQNLKYDMLVLATHGITVRGIAFDTMIASYVVRADGQHNMDALAREYLKYQTITYDDLTGTGKQRLPLRQVPLERLIDYACEDADVTMRLRGVLDQKLQETGLSSLYSDLELPLVPVLTRMEEAGVALDVPYLKGMSKELDRMLENLIRDIHRLGGSEFNINSTQQLGDVLFNRLKLRTVRKTKTGFSTDVAVLEELRNEHPIIERLLEYRQLSKLKSTYVDALPELINSRTGRIHTSFNQTVASTGRLSSSDPNLQNIPIRTDLGRSIRSAFVAGSRESAILSADYSQIELRIMAHISSDEGLIGAFRAGEDIHATTASKVFGVPASEVSRDMRRKAKEVNFGIMYGIGPFGLARRLDLAQNEAKEIIDRYFERFPKVRQYINDTIATVHRQGYVQTLLGRRRYLPDIRSKNNAVRQNAERQAINMPIQGTAADMIKLAMINIDREIIRKHLRTRMILQVHDELVFEVWKNEEGIARTLVSNLMRDALPLQVPVEVELGIAQNWLEAH